LKCTEQPHNSLILIRNEDNKIEVLKQSKKKYFDRIFVLVLKSWKASCIGMGIPINDADLFSLNYAYDQIVLAQDAFDLEYMMRKLKQSYSQWCLCVRIASSRRMYL
jgi:hypothetical protein